MKLAAYKEMINKMIEGAVENKCKVAVLRPINQVGSGRYSSYGVDHTNDYTSYLDSLGVKYTIGNDSPRGGVLGKFIEVKIDKRNTYIKSVENGLKTVSTPRVVNYNVSLENLSKEEIDAFMNEYKESDNVYSFRKANGLSFNDLRAIIKKAGEHNCLSI